MAIYNSTGYTFINTILRKEINGSPITPDRFNNQLNVCFEEKISDEYTKFELNQKNSDFFRFIKKSEVINPDVFGVYDLSSLTYNYWHTSDVYYNNGTRNVGIDEVTDDEWGQRLSSSMELPSVDYPICKIKDGDLVFNPLEQTYSSTNLVTNSGYPGTTDWVDTNVNGEADDWIVFNNTADIITDQFGFDGRAQGAVFDNVDYVAIYRTDFVQERNVLYYCEFEYYIQTGTGSVTLELQLEFSTPLLTFTPTVGKKTKIAFTFYSLESVPVTNLFSINFQNTQLEATRHCYVDKVLLSKADDPTDVNLCYLKQPSTPYFDWYYNANDRILPLSEGVEYTLQTGETYIDKDDGTVRTAGYVITATENKTVEMEIPDDDKRGVFYSMLSKFGIPLDQLDATQYSMQMESKENAK